MDWAENGGDHQKGADAVGVLGLRLPPDLSTPPPPEGPLALSPVSCVLCGRYGLSHRLICARCLVCGCGCCGMCYVVWGMCVCRCRDRGGGGRGPAHGHSSLRSASLSLSLRYYSIIAEVRGVGVCEAYNFQNLLPKTPKIFLMRRAMALRAPRRPNTLMTALGAIIKHLILEPLFVFRLWGLGTDFAYL